MALQVPDRCSMRRAMAITGLGRKALEPLMSDNGRGYRSIPIVDLERFVSRPIDLASWDEATIRISHEGMAMDQGEAA